MSSALPAKKYGGIPERRLFIHVPRSIHWRQCCPMQSRLNSTFGVRSSFVKRNNSYIFFIECQSPKWKMGSNKCPFWDWSGVYSRHCRYFIPDVLGLVHTGNRIRYGGEIKRAFRSNVNKKNGDEIVIIHTCKFSGIRFARIRTFPLSSDSTSDFVTCDQVWTGWSE